MGKIQFDLHVSDGLETNHQLDMHVELSKATQPWHMRTDEELPQKELKKRELSQLSW